MPFLSPRDAMMPDLVIYRVSNPFGRAVIQTLATKNAGNECIIKPFSSGTPVRMRPWHAARKSPKDIRIPSVGFVSAIVSRRIVYLTNSLYEIPPHASRALRRDEARAPK